MKEYICTEEISGGIGIRSDYVPKQELIRCKDCRYYTEPDSKGDRCDKIHWSRGDDWYCADGKRRDDDD